MEVETRKWCWTTWLLDTLRSMCVLTYLVHDLTPRPDLDWSQLLKLTFQGQKVHFLNRLGKTNTMVSFLFSYVFYKKLINEKPSPWKTIIFHLMTSVTKTIDLRSKLIEKRYQCIRRAPQCLLRILPIYHSFGDKSYCLQKNRFSQKICLLVISGDFNIDLSSGLAGDDKNWFLPLVLTGLNGLAETFCAKNWQKLKWPKLLFSG